MEKLHSDNLSQQGSSAATQQFVDVAEVKEDVIVLKNGSLRAILEVSAINFDLKSTDEQSAIISHYQGFLNSLDFPIQVLITSRRFNINNYIEFIEKKEKQQKNELLRMQISEYKNFIRQLVSISDIMDKNFYIIVPFAPVENTKKSSLANIFDIFNPKKNILENHENFETYRNQLLQRMDHITSALTGIGLRLAPLKTQEIIELLYNSYNPNLFIEPEFGDVSKMEII